MLTGDFGEGLLIAFGLLPLLLAMLGTGLWTEQLGRSEAWRIPGSFLVALIAGTILADAGIGLPYARQAVVLGVIAVGLMVVLAAPVRGILGALLIAIIALYQGYGQLGADLSLLGWLGLVSGVILGLAAGIGLAAMIVQGLSASALRGAGLAIVGVGIWLALERL